jgi:dihydroorotase
MCDEDLQEDGRFKMNPPLRGPRTGRGAGGLEGRHLDMIANDTPRTARRKSTGAGKNLMGVTGLECAFAVLTPGWCAPAKCRWNAAGNDDGRARKRFWPAAMDFTPGQVGNPDRMGPFAKRTVTRGILLSGHTYSLRRHNVYGQNRLTLAGGKPYGNVNRKLVMENGSEFLGTGFGAKTDALCEMVFNTSMVGYQEI